MLVISSLAMFGIVVSGSSAPLCLPLLVLLVAFVHFRMSRMSCLISYYVFIIMVNPPRQAKARRVTSSQVPPSPASPSKVVLASAPGLIGQAFSCPNRLTSPLARASTLVNL